MEWKLISVPGEHIKPIYEISSEGDIRRLKTGTFLRGRDSVTLLLIGGSQKKFFRTELVDNVFSTKEWRLIKLPNIKPIYEVSQNREIRKLGNRRIMTGKRIVLETVNGGTRCFFRHKLFELMFPELKDKPLPMYEEPIPESDVAELKEKIHDALMDLFPEECDVRISKYCANMILINGKYSITKERLKYIFRAGRNYDDPTYKSPKGNTGHSYLEIEPEDAFNVTLDLIIQKRKNRKKKGA